MKYVNKLDFSSELLKFPVDTHPQTNKYVLWLKDQVENHGLQAVDYFWSDNKSSDLEELCAELNRMIEAPTLEDPELFLDTPFDNGYKFE